MAVSLRNVAEEAGVSLGTVSHVLNGRTSARISEATQLRVRRAAAELGYRPNHFARSLKQQKTNSIGLMISGVRNPFFAEIIEAAETLTLKAGYQPLLDTAPSSSAASYESHGKLQGWPVDGVLMWAYASQNLAQYLGHQALNIPVVYLGYSREDDSDYVAMDYYMGGRLATTHLISRDYKRIAFVTPYPYEHSVRNGESRLKSFEDACQGVAEIEPTYIQMEKMEETRTAGLETGLAIAARRAELRPQALFCLNDVIASGVYHGLRRGGLRIPEDIAIVGFDGIEETRCLDIPMTTVQSPVNDMLQLALEILINRIKKEGDTSPRQILLSPSLIVGKTT